MQIAKPFSIPAFSFAALLLAVSLSLGWTTNAGAETWQAPIGAQPLANAVACGAISGGWTVTANTMSVEAPKDKAAIGQAVDARVATSAAECTNASLDGGAASGNGAQVVTLIAIGAAPTVDAASVSWFVDEGRLELRGHGLTGARLSVHHGSTWASDVCVAPTADGDFDKCTFAVPRGLPADPDVTRMQLFPAGSRAGDGVVTFDDHGRRLTDNDARVVPAKMIVSHVEATDAALDLGTGRVALAHPEAVASADCLGAHCERADDGVHVHSTGAIPSQVTIHARLAPHVFLAGAGTSLATDATFTVSVLACPMRIVSGAPIRDADDTRVAVEVDARCGDPRTLHFTANGRTADRASQTADGRTVLLSVGRIESDELVVLATRDGATVGQTREKSHGLPLPKAVLELQSDTRVDFVPTNRTARLLVADIDGPLDYVPLSRDGAYSVESGAAGAQLSIRGDAGAVGMVALRFAVRDPSLPAPLASQDLAVVTEPVERPLHEANVPVSLGSSALGDDPIVELVCEDGGKATRIVPGVRTRIEYGARDSCRLVFHRERIAEEAGSQLLNLDIDVTRVDGNARPEAHVSQSIVLRHAPTPRLAWIKGVKSSFDAITVHLSHVIDEAHYVDVAELRTGTPSVQWSVLAGKGSARLYATTAIPTGLYRVSDRAHSGILALNFGALARLTWLDSEGHEGFLGLEAGMMGVGLANDTSPEGKSLTQVATVTGAGLSVPIANRGDATETSINLHAWFEYEPSRALSGSDGSSIGFVFGPSISIGNVGTNL